MSPVAPLLMIASGSIHAVVNAIVKGGRDKMAGRALTDGSSAVILLPATLFVAWPTGAWGWLGASAVLHGFYLYALIRAYQAGDLSAVYPVLRGVAPLITALVTLGALGEPASAQEIAGIALVGAAMFVMVAGKHIERHALGWALATGVCIASYTVIDAHGDYIVWMLQTMRERGARIVDVHQAPEDAYAEHCRDADLATAPLRDCLTYYNGEGNATPGSLAYYGGGRWHKWRIAAQASLEPYIFEPSEAGVSRAAE